MKGKCRSTWPPKCRHTLTGVTPGSCTGARAAQSLFLGSDPDPHREAKCCQGDRPGAFSSPHTVSSQMTFILSTQEPRARTAAHGASGPVFPINAELPEGTQGACQEGRETDSHHPRLRNPGPGKLKPASRRGPFKASRGFPWWLSGK